MPNHYTTIGFAIEEQEDLVRLANEVARTAEAIPVKGGTYLRWSSPCGAEVWLQVDGAGDLLGITPHFESHSNLRVGLTARLEHPDGTPLDGAWNAWAEPEDENPRDGAYPFVFDTPDALSHADLSLPCIRSVRVAGFAHEIEVHASPEAYAAAQEEGARLADRAFIPIGLFHEEEGVPRALALFSGHVLEAALRTNEMTGESFQWVRVDSLGGTWEIVADPVLLEATPPVGSVVSGTYWLSGRILPETGA